MTPEQKQALITAINECDTMILQADIDNTAERAERVAGTDAGRLARYQRRRTALVKHRDGLEKLYVAIHGSNPWANVPY